MRILLLSWNTNYRKYYLFIFFIFYGLNSSHGQQLDFERYYFDSLTSFPDLDNYDVIKTSDNGFLMTGVILGWNETYFLMKMNELGDTLWLKSAPLGGGTIYGQTVKELTNGNYALLCNEFGSYQRLLLLIYDTSGNIVTSNRYNINGDLYITNISESNGYLFLLGQEYSRQGTYLLKTDLFGDSLSYHVDTTFQIANYNNSVCFDGGNFVVAGSTIDTSGTRFPTVAKFDTSGTLIWKVDYPQIPGNFGSQLIQYLGGYIFNTLASSTSPHLLRLDSVGSIVWDIPGSAYFASVLSPDGSRILVAEDDLRLFWYDSSGDLLQYQSIQLALNGTLIKAFAHDQQIILSGTYRTGLSTIYSTAFLAQFTDTSIVSTNDFKRNQNGYVYPTICSAGENLSFHTIDKISKEMKIAIYSSLGTCVMEDAILIFDSFSDPTIKIPNSISSGLYFIKIFSNNSYSTFRIIVQ